LGIIGLLKDWIGIGEGLTYPGKELISTLKLPIRYLRLELTANRGDCLSIYGVARDLSAALDIPLNNLDYEGSDKLKIGLARIAELKSIWAILEGISKDITLLKA